ncbi:MAG: hypothetical protein RMI91_15200, partial [Gemmatales bacterium]|nr:hypothetical protein [Gemmatales bacterium]
RDDKAGFSERQGGLSEQFFEEAGTGKRDAEFVALLRADAERFQDGQTDHGGCNRFGDRLFAPLVAYPDSMPPISSGATIVPVPAFAPVVALPNNTPAWYVGLFSSSVTPASTL